jgi:endogenous inhibitor of DNA gyrase (YacG/DUF329 family)
MIPVSVSDMLKLLDQIPIWKAVSGLPKRVANLERKVADLQEKSAGTIALPTGESGRECPICGATMKVTLETPHRHFGFSSLKIHHMECPECRHKTTRTFRPGAGYQ